MLIPLSTETVSPHTNVVVDDGDCLNSLGRVRNLGIIPKRTLDIINFFYTRAQVYPSRYYFVGMKLYRLFF